MRTHILIDGTNLAWQVYHSAKHTSKSFDQHTPETANEIIYGVLNVLSPALNPSKKNSLGSQLKTDTNIILALDKGNSWRYDSYPNYKNGSRPAKEAPQKSRFGAQIDRLPSQLAKLGISTLSVDGLEGDDILALLSLKSDKDNFVLVSKDKDLIGLVSDNVSYYNQASKTLITKDNFSKSVSQLLKGSFDELTPKNWFAFRAFAGDKSDNISGVDNCAENTAYKIILELEKLGIKFNGIHDNADKLVQDLQALSSKLPKQLQQFVSNSSLVKFKDSFNVANFLNAPSNLKNEITCNEIPILPKPSVKQVEETLTDLNFQHFIKQIPNGWASSFASQSVNMELNL